MYSKSYVLDYLWQHSRFAYSCLVQAEQLFREGKGYASVIVLFSCMENIAKSVVNDYESNLANVYGSLYEREYLTDKEYDFLSRDACSLRKIRNRYAHANCAAISLIVNESGHDVYWPLTEDDTSLLIYEKIGDIVFNLILKIVCADMIEQVRNSICVNMDDAIGKCDLRFKLFTLRELLVVKGYPEDYFDGVTGIPEHALFRMLDNAPNIAEQVPFFQALASEEMSEE